jgi:predicted transcriptional regulator
MDSEGVADTIALLARRGDVLRAVPSTGSEKGDIVENVSVSRSTVDRAVRRLLDAGLLRRSDGQYHRTLTGELALREYDTVAGRLRGLSDASAVLSTLSSDVDVDAALFEDATIVETTHPAHPTALSRFVSLVDRSSYVVGFAPAVFPAEVDVFRDRLLDGDLSARMVIIDPVFERLVTRYADDLATGLRTNRIQLRCSDELPPFTLVVGATAGGAEVGLLTHTDTGISGYVENDSAEALRWARKTIASYWRDATSLPLGNASDE